MCKFTSLASRGPFRVEVCEHCDCVHVHIGPMSVRLDEAAVSALSGVLGEALQQRSALSRQTTWPLSTPVADCN